MTSNPDNIAGAEALALGAWDAGVSMVAGYPGAPVTRTMNVLQQIATDQPGTCDARWNVNERVALDVTVGVSLTGRRALCVMKSVGFNVIIDELQLVNLTGLDGGLVILLGDDPTAAGSQNNQDSRLLVRAVELPIIEPDTPADGYRAMLDSFDLSEQLELPVVVRIVGDFAASRGKLPNRRERKPNHRIAVSPDARHRLSAPPIVGEKHSMLHGKLHTAATVMTAWPGNVIGDGHANHGIITVGHCGTKYETLKSDYIAPESPRFFQLETPFPLPDDLIAEFCDDLALCLIIEEGEPFVEEQVRALLQRRGLPVRVLGRQTGTMPDKLDVAGVDIFRALNQCMPEICLSDAEPPEPAPPVRLSEFALEPDCPFYDVCQVLRICMEAAPGGLPRLVGEPGCNVRLRLPPFDLFEYRVAMGSGTGVAAGLAAGDETRRAVAVIGDSAFVHSGLSPLVDAVRHGRKALIIIMDNGVLGVTGCQSGPSTGNNAVDLPGLCRACGVEKVEVVTTHDKEQLATVFNEALAANDLRVLILSYPCSRCVDNLKQG